MAESIDVGKASKSNTKPKVRYAVHYKDRNYEYALHSSKGHFLRNLADVVNVLEYCVTMDLKAALYKPDQELYNFEVVRLVNDEVDGAFDQVAFKVNLDAIVKRAIEDNIQRNT